MPFATFGQETLPVLYPNRSITAVEHHSPFRLRQPHLMEEFWTLLECCYRIYHKKRAKLEPLNTSGYGQISPNFR